MKAKKKWVINTPIQYQRWLKENHAGWGIDFDADMQGQPSCEDAVYDMARGMIDFPDLAGEDGTREALAYLKKSGVTDILGRLADDLYDVRYEE